MILMLIIFYWSKDDMKLCQCLIFHTKLHMVQGLYVFLFDKVDGDIRKYDKTNYLAHSENIEKNI